MGNDSIAQRLMAMLSRPAGPTVPASPNGFPLVRPAKPREALPPFDPLPTSRGGVRG